MYTFWNSLDMISQTLLWIYGRWFHAKRFALEENFFPLLFLCLLRFVDIVQENAHKWPRNVIDLFVIFYMCSFVFYYHPLTLSQSSPRFLKRTLKCFAGVKWSDKICPFSEPGRDQFWRESYQNDNNGWVQWRNIYNPHSNKPAQWELTRQRIWKDCGFVFSLG